uniref:Uncharacterized protein n=1 Tax=Rhizophora mucronata TaxID=61149 RepID=A0A2P2NC87_RHIMU
MENDFCMVKNCWHFSVHFSFVKLLAIHGAF